MRMVPKTVKSEQVSSPVLQTDVFEGDMTKQEQFLKNLIENDSALNDTRQFVEDVLHKVAKKAGLTEMDDIISDITQPDKLRQVAQEILDKK